MLGELMFSVEINSSERNIARKDWITENKLDIDKPSGQVNMLLGKKEFVLPPGQYRAFIKISDLNDSSSYATVEFPLVINDNNRKRPFLSDIELAQIIEPENAQTRKWDPIFYKNGLYVAPNPSLEIIGTMPELKAYSEIYDADGGESEINYIIFDGARREVFRAPKQINAKSNAIVDIVELPLEALPSGVYYLKIELAKGDDTSSSYKKFYVLNPNMPAELTAEFNENEAFELSEFATLSDEQLEKEWRQSRVISTEPEREQWDKLETQAAKRRYLYRFWYIRDPDAKTRINERREDFRKSIEYANTYFSTGKIRQGWDTERGHIMLKYGIPTQRNRHTSDPENRAYEEWIYDNVQGGAAFYFVDTIGSGNYLLVHSTARGELANARWFQDYVPYDKRSDKKYDTNPTGR